MLINTFFVEKRKENDKLLKKVVIYAFIYIQITHSSIANF